jgi:hypothetical protein
MNVYSTVQANSARSQQHTDCPVIAWLQHKLDPSDESLKPVNKKPITAVMYNVSTQYPI